MSLLNLKGLAMVALLATGVAKAEGPFDAHLKQCKPPSTLRAFTVGSDLYEINRDLNPALWALDFVGLTNHSKHYLIYSAYYICVAKKVVPNSSVVNLYETEFNVLASRYKRTGASNSIESKAKTLLQNITDRLEVYSEDLQSRKRDTKEILDMVSRTQNELQGQLDYFEKSMDADGVIASYKADVDAHEWHVTRATYDLLSTKAYYENKIQKKQSFERVQASRANQSLQNRDEAQKKLEGLESYRAEQVNVVRELFDDERLSPVLRDEMVSKMLKDSDFISNLDKEIRVSSKELRGAKKQLDKANDRLTNATAARKEAERKRDADMKAAQKELQARRITTSQYRAELQAVTANYESSLEASIAEEMNAIKDSLAILSTDKGLIQNEYNAINSKIKNLQDSFGYYEGNIWGNGSWNK